MNEAAPVPSPQPGERHGGSFCVDGGCNPFVGAPNADHELVEAVTFDSMTDEAGPAFFGEPWGSFVTQPGQAQRVATPVGQRCRICDEPVVAGDRGFIRTVARSVEIPGTYEITPVHAECEALGFVGHTFGVCSCTGHDTTSRASARLLWERLSTAAHGNLFSDR